MNPNPYAAPRTSDGEPAPAADAAVVVSIVCHSCSAEIHLGQAQCPGCNRPVTDDERGALQRRWEASDSDAAAAADESNWGRVALGVAAALAAVQASFTFFLEGHFLWGATLAVVMGLLFLWSFRHPRGATGVALGTYLLWWFGPLAFAPLMVLDGVLLRGGMLMALLAGFTAERTLEKRRRAIGAQAAPPR
jgi:hypothetical protein